MGADPFPSSLLSPSKLSMYQEMQTMLLQRSVYIFRRYCMSNCIQAWLTKTTLKFKARTSYYTKTILYYKPLQRSANYLVFSARGKFKVSRVNDGYLRIGAPEHDSHGLSGFPCTVRESTSLSFESVSTKDATTEGYGSPHLPKFGHTPNFLHGFLLHESVTRGIRALADALYRNVALLLSEQG